MPVSTLFVDPAFYAGFVHYPGYYPVPIIVYSAE
jgi:hypothetical protein